MRLGSLCHIKSKKNALQSFMVLYSDIEDVLKERNKNNSWLPCMLATKPIVLPTKSIATKPATESFVLLNEMQDENGNIYYRCLYSDIYGWIIGSKKHFEVVKDKV